MINAKQLPLMVSTIPFTPESPQITELLEKGFGLEIFLDWPQWCDEWQIEEKVRAWRNTYGPFPVSVHATMIEGSDLTAPQESRVYELTMAAYHRAIEFAGRLGALHVVIHSHGHHTIVTNENRELFQNRVKEALPLLVNWAEKAGTVIVVENIGSRHEETLLFEENDYVKLFSEVEGIQSLIDIGHGHLNQWNLPDVIERLKNDIVSFHVHDNYGEKDEHNSMGNGSVDWGTLLPKLLSPVCLASLVIEYDSEVTADFAQNYSIFQSLIRTF
ncbi:MAG: sugar phosphate isomerase/epimerase [Negativicutes bacterium]|nr:sugar phosphate isomerase/epimerase [Negativicutes bacterium]